MKKIILFALATSLLLGSAAAATKSKVSTASQSASSKMTADEKKGYEAGYKTSLSGKTDPFSAKLSKNARFQKGYLAGLAQHAYDEGVKVGLTIDANFDYSKIPPYENSKKACENWILGYKSMFTIALAGWNAGYDAYEKSGDSCTVPAKYKDGSALYKKHYKKAHDNAVQIYQDYIAAYKRGYATTEESSAQGDRAARRRGEEEDENSGNWYTDMFNSLSNEVKAEFGSKPRSFGTRYGSGFSDGYNDRKSGKPSKF